MVVPRFAFQIYDLDSDGFINNEELYNALKAMVGGNLKDKQLQEVVNRTLNYADKDADGRIDFEEFCAIIGNLGFYEKMSVEV
jgi:serine/threonine-protein phosphatase 2B regulatory subunit